jgi:hypothetical protein
MPVITDMPFMVQVNWQKDSAWGAWDAANANILCYHNAQPTLIEIAARRGIMYPVIGADTVTIRAFDPDWNLVPRKADSVLYPSTFTGCPIRVLEQMGLHTNVWNPRFFGYITKVMPDEVTATRRSSVTVTAESPLRYLGARNVTPAPLAAGAPVWSLSTPNALQNLLTAASLWVPGYLNLEPPDAEIPLPGDWGGAPVQFGSALADLAFLAHAAVRAIPLYAIASGAPDWTLKWWVPQFDTPALELHAPLGDLWTGASVEWGDEGVP